MWLCDGCARYGDVVDGKVLTDVMDVAEKHNGCGRWEGCGICDRYG